MTDSIQITNHSWRVPVSYGQVLNLLDCVFLPSISIGTVVCPLWLVYLSLAFV